MTNTEHTKMEKEINEAFAVLISQAYKIRAGRFAVKRLQDERHFLCEQCFDFYKDNKSNSY